MIPKVIHYCWFGRNPLPQSAIKCIESWKKFFPDYDIKEWNEDNFDVNMIPYTEEAYTAGKYAFVSDFARFWILYNNGGIYFDTDVEVIKPMDDILDKGAFMGAEINPNSRNKIAVNPGLGMASEPKSKIYKEILNYYNELRFFDKNGFPMPVTVVKHTTNVLLANGLKQSNDIQKVAGVWIYPKDYFNPLDNNTGKLVITENTRSIHWYSKTWIDRHNPLRTWIVRKIHRYFGNDSLVWLKKFAKH